MGNKAKKYNTGESWQDLHAKYVETDNIVYAALAIGESSEFIPQWALDACKKYYSAVQIAHIDKVLMKDLTSKTTLDDKKLDEIAELYLKYGTEFTAMPLKKGDGYLEAAINLTFPKDPDESQVRKMHRYWRQEEIPERDHHRLERIGKRLIEEIERTLKK